MLPEPPAMTRFNTASLYHCDQCSIGRISFTSQQELIAHRKQFHMRTCLLRYADNTPLNVTRRQNGTWVCPVCGPGVVFEGSSENLKKHWRSSRHDSDTPAQPVPAVPLAHPREDSAMVKDSSDDEDEIEFIGVRFRDDTGALVKEEEIELISVKFRDDAGAAGKTEEFEVEEFLVHMEDIDDQMDVDSIPDDTSTGGLMYPPTDTGGDMKEETTGIPIISQQAYIPAHNNTAIGRSRVALAIAHYPALQAFLDSLLLPMDHVRDTYIEQGYTSDEAFDYIAGIARERNPDFRPFKEKLVKRGNWIAWYAFDEGLVRRAKAKGIRVEKAEPVPED